jgi:hypothetical protein
VAAASHPCEGLGDRGASHRGHRARRDCRTHREEPASARRRWCGHRLISDCILFLVFWTRDVRSVAMGDHRGVRSSTVQLPTTLGSMGNAVN